MVVQSADAAIANANAYTSCDPGMCLKYVRTWLEIPSMYGSAAEAWAAAEHRHKGDREPPRGAPLFWTGGSKGYGHIALALATSMRSTDVPATGKVGNDDGSFPRTQWGHTYAGWAEDVNGILIPYLTGGAAAADDWRASGDVYVDKLHQGQHDSDSVARLRWRLDNHPDLQGSGHRPGYGNDYGQQVVEAVRYWQRNIAGGGAGINGPTDGTSMSNPQANSLFGDTYTVHEK